MAKNVENKKSNTENTQENTAHGNLDAASVGVEAQPSEKKFATGVLKNPTRFFALTQSVKQLGEAVRKFLSAAFIKTRNTSDKSLNCFDECKKELNIKKEQAVEFVREHPKQSAVLAAGVGAAVFLLVLTALEKSKKR